MPYRFILVTAFILFFQNLRGQNDQHGDSLKTMLEGYSSVTAEDPGLQLMREEKYPEASAYFTNIISKDESARDAYFKRGVANWELNDSGAACRDWSAVLALGDTATFLLLDSKCHGNMVIGEDTLTSRRYREIFSNNTKQGTAFRSDRKGEKAKTAAEQMPEFPGKDAGLFGYLKNNLVYPPAARKNRTQGRVYVNFVVNSKGRVMFPYVVRGIGNGCDEEALRLIRNMPKWKPATLNGKPVAVRYSVPVKFELH